MYHQISLKERFRAQHGSHRDQSLGEERQQRSPDEHPEEGRSRFGLLSVHPED